MSHWRWPEVGSGCAVWMDAPGPLPRRCDLGMRVQTGLFYQQETALARLHAKSCNLFRFRSEAGESGWALPLLLAAKPGEATAHKRGGEGSR